MEIRLLRSNEIECRAQQVSKNGIMLLLYKDARCDMKILDELFPNKWQREHELINGNLFCTISFWNDELKQWIKRMDVGTESNTEKEKGQASDSFKRAGTNIGIGRELYTSPFIWITPCDGEIVQKNGKDVLKPGACFKVKEIGYDSERTINHLVIADKNGTERFRMGSKQTGPKDTPPAPPPPKETGKSEQHICAGYGELCGAAITEDEYRFSMRKFRTPLCRACQKKAEASAY